MDKNGNESDDKCPGCKLVCRKCQAGYYLKKNNNKCKKIPKNCAQVNTNTGKCTKCKSGFRLKGNACVKNKWLKKTKWLNNCYKQLMIVTLLDFYHSNILISNLINKFKYFYK